MSARTVLIAALCVAATGCGIGDASSGVRAGSSSHGAEIVTDSGFGGGGGGGGAESAAAVAGESRGLGDGPERADASPDGDALAWPETVAVVGDSLTLSAQDEIESALTDLGLSVVAIDGVESRRMARGDFPPGTDAVEEILDAGHTPELWIVALGTNDVGAQVSERDFGDDMAAVLRLIPSGAPVVWVDVWIRDLDDEAVEANEVIRSMLALRPHSGVVDWYAHGDDEGVITGDGVHLTDAGRERFAAAMATAVDAMYGG